MCTLGEPKSSGMHRQLGCELFGFQQKKLSFTFKGTHMILGIWAFDVTSNTIPW